MEETCLGRVGVTKERKEGRAKWATLPVRSRLSGRNSGKKSGKTPETLSERFLEFPSRVRLGSPKPYNSRQLRLPEHFQKSLPPVRLGTPLFSEVVLERASQSRSWNSQQYWGYFCIGRAIWAQRVQTKVFQGPTCARNSRDVPQKPKDLKKFNLAWNFQSGLKTSISLEIFNLDLQNSPTTKKGFRRWLASKMFNLAWNFQSRRAILNFFNLWALRVPTANRFTSKPTPVSNTAILWNFARPDWGKEAYTALLQWGTFLCRKNGATEERFRW